MYYNYLRSLLPPPLPKKIPRTVGLGGKELTFVKISVPSKVIGVLHTLSHLMFDNHLGRKADGVIPILLTENVLLRVE